MGLTTPVEEGQLLTAAIKRIEELERQLGASRSVSHSKDDKDSSGGEEEGRAGDVAPIVTPDGKPVP